MNEDIKNELIQVCLTAKMVNELTANEIELIKEAVYPFQPRHCYE